MKQQPRKDAAVEFMYLVASGKVQEAYDRHVGRNFRHQPILPRRRQIAPHCDGGKYRQESKQES